MAKHPMSLDELAAFLRSHLLESVVPFWLRHGIDPRGGLNTCLRDDGTLVSDDKYLWSQWRAVYAFSALYRRIEPRPEWLDLASRVYRFCAAHGRDENGRWRFRLSAAGEPIEGDVSLYTDGFAIIGAVEYFRATGDTGALRLATETFETVERHLARPGSYTTHPYEIPAGLKAHGVSMIFSHAFHELGRATGDARVNAAALRLADEVMDHFLRPDRGVLLEYVTLDGAPQDSPIGRTVVPGHAIESMWFQIQQYERLGRPDRVRRCVECIRWHLERGWDREYGGLLLGLDADGKEPVYWRFHDAKIWWPHTEALYALLKAHQVSGEPWCLDWYWRVHELTFARFPVPGHGEWTARFDRQFRPLEQVVALPVKDPFHLPRALALSVELLMTGTNA